MAKIRITKEFAFEMAHALFNYDGLCKTAHGHSYRLYVTIIGLPEADASNVKLGMVLDFGDLKRIVKENIVDKYDHALVINKKSRHLLPAKKSQLFDRLIVENYQPTCENMVAHFAQIISDKLPDGVDLFSVKLNETSTSYAEWFAGDN